MGTKEKTYFLLALSVFPLSITPHLSCYMKKGGRSPGCHRSLFSCTKTPLVGERREILFRGPGQGGKIKDDYGGLGPTPKEAFLSAAHERKRDTERHGFNQLLQPGHWHMLLTWLPGFFLA